MSRKSKRDVLSEALSVIEETNRIREQNLSLQREVNRLQELLRKARRIVIKVVA